MTIQQFIDKAIDGGWDESNNPRIVRFRARSDETLPVEMALLDPEAWKAVGKVEGWGWSEHMGHPPAWRNNMHRMIDALVDGKTIEEYLADL